MASLEEDLTRLIGSDNTEKIFANDLDKIIDISEFTPENLEYAQDFFDNVDYEKISKYMGDEFTFFDVVKKFYDVELPLEIVVSDAQKNLILDRRFSFDTKKKIVQTLNLFDEPKFWDRALALLKIMDDDDDFLTAQVSFKEIILSDKLYNKILEDKKNLADAANIAKYNLHNLKKELSFENLVWLVNIFSSLTAQSQNPVRIWINNIKSDEDCKKLEPLLISLINCEKLTDDVGYKKISVEQAIEIYKDIKSKVNNENLSVKNLNNAFSIIMQMRDDKSFDEKNIATAINLISLIRDDSEFEQIKIFIGKLSHLEILPNVIQKNNFTLTEVLPLALNICFMDAQSLLKQNFSFDCISEAVKILLKCNKHETKIVSILKLISKINNDSEFVYCKRFLFDLAENEKVVEKICTGKLNLLDKIEALYRRYFNVSHVSNYILQIIHTRKFSFEITKEIDRLIFNKTPIMREVTTNLILKLNCDSEFVFANKFLSEVEYLNEYENTTNLLADIKNYYKTILQIRDFDENKLKILENANLSFENISDAVNLLDMETDEDLSAKLTQLISILQNADEYDALRPFFYKLVETDTFVMTKGNVFWEFKNILYAKASQLKIRKIFDNKFLSLFYRAKAMDYLEQVENVDMRNSIADLITILKSDNEYDRICIYFDRLSPIRNLNEIIKTYGLDAEQIIQICKLNVDRIWIKDLISFDRIKKLAIYMAKCEKEKAQGILEFMDMLEDNDEFDSIFSHLDELFSDNKILIALSNEEITVEALCNLYKLKAEKILKNTELSFAAKNFASEFLMGINNSERLENAINVIAELNKDKDVVYIKEFLLMGNVDKANKNYSEQARKFYLERLIKLYGQKYKDIGAKIERLVNSNKFSYLVLEQSAKIMNTYKKDKERGAIFRQIMMFKDDNDFMQNHSILFNINVGEKDEESKKTSFNARLKKASENAESINKEIDANSGYSSGGLTSSPVIFDDENLVVNLVDKNIIIQMKDKKLVIMTTEDFDNANKSIKGRATTLSIKINELIDANLEMFDSGEDYFEQFKTYLTEKNYSASIEEDEDDGEKYCCLIIENGLEKLIEEHESFISALE